MIQYDGYGLRRKLQLLCKWRLIYGTQLTARPDFNSRIRQTIQRKKTQRPSASDRNEFIKNKRVTTLIRNNESKLTKEINAAKSKERHYEFLYHKRQTENKSKLKKKNIDTLSKPVFITAKLQ